MSCVPFWPSFGFLIGVICVVGILAYMFGRTDEMLKQSDEIAKDTDRMVRELLDAMKG